MPREAVVERMVTISLEDLRSWLRNASYHIRLAVAIAALAPKLRLANVLALTWNEHIDPDLRYITVHRHRNGPRTSPPPAHRSTWPCAPSTSFTGNADY